MFKLTFSILVFVLFHSNIQAQQASFSGTVTDTIQKKPVKNVVVALLHPGDSILLRFTRTDASGNYHINQLPFGQYILLTTHPYFADMIQTIDVNTASFEVPGISLTSKSKLLEEVIVKSGSPIKIKGDTTVFTADSFKVRAGANVEELLKKLPGIQVDKNGKITAMGEQVKKVLVDGEEFFGDDPGIATKNLRADIVKEVEVYDKKSDQAVFTGIDDGVKDKTINLKLKDNAKKGYFGKAEVGTDFKNYFNNSIMGNDFKGKRKLAAYGIMSNTGQTNLDWQDAQNFGGGNDNMMFMEDGMGIAIMNESDEGSQGSIPTNWNGGLHYSNKFNNDKQSLNTGYKFTKLNSPSGQTTFTKNFIGDSSYSTNTASNGYSSKFKQTFNGSFETMLDSANTLKFTVKGNSNSSTNNNNYHSESFTDALAFINKSDRKTSGKVDNLDMNATALWKHKFKKKSRTISINTDFTIKQAKSDGFLYTLNDFYKTGIPISHDTTDQQNIRDNRSQNYSTNITYTEPLSKTLFMSLNYNFSIANSSNNRKSFVKDGFGGYSKLIDSLSNQYRYNQVSNRPGIDLRWNKKKLNVGIGTTIAYNNFEQKNISTGVNRPYDFLNIFPRANLRIKMKKNQFINANYNGSSQPPSLDQLQPITDNSDVLNKTVGNPDLKQSFQHNVNLGYNFYNVLKERNLWMNIWSSFTQKAFVSETTIDLDSAKNIHRTVNANGVYNINFYSQYGFKLKKPGIWIRVGPSISQVRNVTVLNTIKSGLPVSHDLAVNNNSRYSLNIEFNKEKENKYGIGFNSSFGITKVKNSINTLANAQYRTLELSANGDLTILKKYQLHSDVRYEARQKDPRFPTKNNYTLWNAMLSRKFVKDKLELGLFVSDILNQNRGFDRNFSDYRYTESYYNTLKRYCMLNLTWNFSKNHAAVQNMF
ncbi:MAG: outer membrane beta-barrel protein [Sphingobacteriales bacterium]|nr:outer membrane beta-barrel protein [Sphingobacteriales bacterium]